MKNAFLLFYCFLFSLSGLSFSGFEHLSIGDNLIYYFPQDYTGLGQQEFGTDYPYTKEMAKIKQELDYVLPIKGQYLIIKAKDGKADLRLSPGEILALAGDFIANPEQIISKPQASWDELKQRFMSAYDFMTPYDDNWFWTTTFLKKDRLPRYRNNLKNELLNFIEVVKNTKQEYPLESERRGKMHLKLISGKNAVEKIIEQALLSNDFYKYKELLNKNIDHFEKDGVQAYQAGHLLALESAVAAKSLYDQDRAQEGRMGLNQAYALEAFAQHFLSDQFAAGHLLTPRRGLIELSHKNPEFSSVDVGLMANAQHDETNWLGLLVKNQAGDVWTSYGDNGHFDQRSVDNAEHMRKTLQASVDEVWQAFNSSLYPEPELFIVHQYLPKALAMNENQSHNQLFIEKNDQFLVRSNVYDYMSSAYKPIKPVFISSLRTWLKSPADKYNSSDFSSFEKIGLSKKLRLEVSIKCYSKYAGSGLYSILNKGEELKDKYTALYLVFDQFNFINTSDSINRGTKMYIFNTNTARDISKQCEALLGSKPVNIRAKAESLSHLIPIIKKSIKISPFWLPVGVYDEKGFIYRLKGDGEDYFKDHYLSKP